MKILIGVCGIGFGHSTRQRELAMTLRQRGHEIKILTFGQAIDVFKKDFDTHEVWVPWIAGNKKGIDWMHTITKNFFSYIPGNMKNTKVFRRLEETGFIPNVCISDYEPTTAKFSYKHGLPLLLVDQQSKFLEYDFTDIGNFSRKEERDRLNMFFPTYVRKFIISFFKLPKAKNGKVEVVPPIFRSDLLSSCRKKTANQRVKLLAYFSLYGRETITQCPEEVMALFRKFSNIDFVIYFSEELARKCINETNVIVKQMNRESFVKDLICSDGIISTAGHTLISEAMKLGIPFYAIPLSTFDQHYCARFIESNGLGAQSSILTEVTLDKFIKNLDLYKNEIKHSKKLLVESNAVDTIINFIEVNYGKKGDYKRG